MDVQGFIREPRIFGVYFGPLLEQNPSFAQDFMRFSWFLVFTGARSENNANKFISPDSEPCCLKTQNDGEGFLGLGFLSAQNSKLKNNSNSKLKLKTKKETFEFRV